MIKYKNPECPKCKDKAEYMYEELDFVQGEPNNSSTCYRRGIVRCLCGKEWHYKQTIANRHNDVREFIQDYVYDKNGSIIRGSNFIL